MSAIATQAPAPAPAPAHAKITNQRRLGLVAMSAALLVAGLAVWSLTSKIGENTGAMVGIVVASIGLTFFFPALQSYLLARRSV